MRLFGERLRKVVRRPPYCWPRPVRVREMRRGCWDEALKSEVSGELAEEKERSKSSEAWEGVSGDSSQIASGLTGWREALLAI